MNRTMIINTGFFSCDDPIIKLIKLNNPKDNLFFETDDFVPINAYDFIKGICHVFAYVLNEEFKYDIYELYDKNDNYLHHFCMSKYKNIDLYIDVRGITSDEKKFAEEFGIDDTSNKKLVSFVDKKDGFNNYTLEFAKYVLNKNYDYYLDKIIDV